MVNIFYATRFKILSLLHKIPSTFFVEQKHLYDERWELAEDHSVFDSDNWKIQPCKNSILMISKHARIYGKYDIKVISPKGWGNWFSIKLWNLGQNKYTKIGIITIIKGNVANIHCSVEYRQIIERKYNIKKYSTVIKNVPQLINQPYIYTIEWNNSSIIWYINDIKIATTRIHTPPTALHTLIGTRMKQINAEKFDIEYLRVFEQK